MEPMVHLVAGSSAVLSAISGAGTHGGLGLSGQLTFWDVLGSGVTGVVGFVLYLFGSIAWVIAKALFGLAFSFINGVVFNPLTLTGGPIGYAFSIAWTVMRDVSGAVALLMLAWAMFRHHLTAVTGKPTDRTEITHGVITWAAVVIGGTVLFNMILSVADQVTKSMASMATTSALSQLNNMPTMGATGSLAALVTVWITMDLAPMALLVIAGVMIWGIFVWLSRLVDLVFYASLLPMMAALSVSGEKRYFQWCFNETIGALFSQMAMAITWWIAWLVFLQPAGIFNGGTVWDQFIHLGLLAVGLTLFARSPQLLQRVTGHNSAGVMSMALGVAAGSLMASTTRSAWGISKMGVLSDKLKGNIREKSEESLLARGVDQTPTLGKGLLGATATAGGVVGRGALDWMKGDFNTGRERRQTLAKSGWSAATAAGLSSTGLAGTGRRYVASVKETARGVGKMALFGSGMVAAPVATSSKFAVGADQGKGNREEHTKTLGIGVVHEESLAQVASDPTLKGLPAEDRAIEATRRTAGRFGVDPSKVMGPADAQTEKEKEFTKRLADYRPLSKAINEGQGRKYRGYSGPGIESTPSSGGKSPPNLPTKPRGPAPRRKG